jgi:hypothetical protein
MGLGKGFAQEELDVATRTSLERAEHLISEPLIKWPGLKIMCLERSPDRASKASIGLRLL